MMEMTGKFKRKTGSMRFWKAYPPLGGGGGCLGLISGGATIAWFLGSCLVYLVAWVGCGSTVW